MKKLLIAGGCSFTHGDINWPVYLGEELNCSVNNVALPSLGNNLILHKTIIAVQQALEKYSSDEILVGIVWSGITRYSFRATGSLGKDNINDINYFPTSINGDKSWYQHSIHAVNFKKSDSFYKYHYDQTVAAMDTLEKIILAQKLLNDFKVDYFMGTFIEMFNKNNIDINNPDVRYLYNFIDKSKFLPVDGILPNNPGGLHPTHQQSKKFVHKYIIPFLNND